MPHFGPSSRAPNHQPADPPMRVSPTTATPDAWTCRVASYGQKFGLRPPASAVPRTVTNLKGRPSSVAPPDWTNTTESNMQGHPPRAARARRLARQGSAPRPNSQLATISPTT
jgi:hypothetical protein